MKINKINIILIILILFFSSLILFFYIKGNKEKFNNVYIIENEDYYNIKVNYQIFDNTKFSNKLKRTINEKIVEFKNEIKDLDKNKKYEFNVESNIADNNKNLYSIHIIIYKYTGGAHYNREDLMYYYDYVKNEELYWDDIFINNDETLEQLSALTKEKLISEHKDYLYNEQELNDGIKPIKENFQFISLNENDITVIFPPYQVAPWSTGEIDIKLSYDKINNILNKEFKKEEAKTVDKTTSEDKRITRNINTLKEKKLIALTFDDGPAYRTTEKLLDGLKERNAKVSFFVLGSRVKQLPEIIKRAYNDGHTIGSHTYNHKNLLNLSDNDVLYEINTTNEIIKSITGASPTFLRPPYGSFNEHILNISNMNFVLWNVDTLDWKNKNIDSIYNEIIKSAKDGQIILLHDIYETSVDAALKAIDTLKNEGYEFVSFEELNEIKRIDINQKHYFYSFY